MKNRPKTSEKAVLEEVAYLAKELKQKCRGLIIGYFIKMIRAQLGMSQSILAKRSSVPQSTISRIEKGENSANLSTLNKILNSLFCDLVLAPLLRNSIEEILQAQAKKKAEEKIRYLKGTMSLEDQQPDSRFMEILFKEEVERLLHGPGSKLWED